MNADATENLPSTYGYRLLGDSPLGEARTYDPRINDQLDFDSCAHKLKQLIMNARPAMPFTLGIQAPWGRGKSSLMRKLERQLSLASPGFRTVWFNAWTFEGQDVLGALIRNVVEQLDPSVVRRMLRQKKLIAWGRVIFNIALGWLRMDNLSKTLWNKMNVDPSVRNELRTLLAESMEALKKKNRKKKGGSDQPVAVFIDDLDRCSPENIVRVFEAIKLYLDAPDFVFIVGIDSDMVAQAVAGLKQYSDAQTFERYVEKIIQVSYEIPKPSEEQSLDLFKMYAEASGTLELFDESDMRFTLEQTEANPRRIKRFLNVFVLQHTLDQASKRLGAKLLIKSIMISMFYREFRLLFGKTRKSNVLTFFIKYRDATTILDREPDSRTPAQTEELIELLDYLDLPGREKKASRDAAADLEASVPRPFVQLRDNLPFVELVRSITPGSRDGVADYIKRAGDILAGDVAEKVNEERGLDPESRLSPLSILLIEDEGGSHTALSSTWTKQGATVVSVPDAAAARESLSEDPSLYNMLLVDLKDEAGFEPLLEEVIDTINDVGFEGPCIFYMTIVRPAMVSRVAGSGIAITSWFDTMQVMMVTAAEDAHRAQFGDSLESKFEAFNQMIDQACEMLGPLDMPEVISALSPPRHLADAATREAVMRQNPQPNPARVKRSSK